MIVFNDAGEVEGGQGLPACLETGKTEVKADKLCRASSRAVLSVYDLLVFKVAPWLLPTPADWAHHLLVLTFNKERIGRLCPHMPLPGSSHVWGHRWLQP